MSSDRPTPKETEQALNMLAVLCGTLMRVMHQRGTLTTADIEGIMGSMEQGAALGEMPLISSLLDQVRWAAEWRPKPSDRIGAPPA